MIIPNDTIAAISTPKGNGAIHVLRVSGKKSIETVNKIFLGKDLKKAKHQKVYFGKLIYNKKTIDEVLVTIFLSPHSYTGEDLVEISCHGNFFIANQILEILLMSVRMANPGEFTQRAFLNQKMDLTQAEAVNDLLNAKTIKSQEMAINNLEGKLYKLILELINELKNIRATLELEIDFIEQGLETYDTNYFIKEISNFSKKLVKLIKSGKNGIILNDGLKISLVGLPNVGKSSIFNTFLQSERAIVTPIPGTTRDYLEEAFALDGYLIRLFDTAGIRDTDDSIELIGINNSKNIIEKSNIILFVNDSPTIPKQFKELLFKYNHKVIKVLNKSDLKDKQNIKEAEKENFIPCSAINPNGLNKLKKKILEQFRTTEEEDCIKLTNTRQIAAVNKSFESIKKSINALNSDMGFEFVAFDLKEASEFLEEITGKITNDELLSHIFENFCIGK